MVITRETYSDSMQTAVKKIHHTILIDLYAVSIIGFQVVTITQKKHVNYPEALMLVSGG